MEWNNENTFQLIEEYREHTCLWNPTDDSYKLTLKKNDAWINIAEKLNKDVSEVKKKMNSLLTSFRRERHKEKVVKSGSGSKEKYSSTWFAFKNMMFLLDKFKSRETLDAANNEDADIQNNNENCKENDNESDVIEASSQKKEFKSPVKATSSRKRKVEDPRVNEAYNILQETISKRSKRDDCDVFAEHVACKLRSYSRQTKNIVQHHINNILFDADMGKFELCGSAMSPLSSPTPFSSSSPQPVVLISNDSQSSQNFFDPSSQEHSSTPFILTSSSTQDHTYNLSLNCFNK